MNAANKRRARGFTLIEVLIALFILAIGVLGLAGVQMKALSYNQTSVFRTQATHLAYNIADCMRANRQAARNGAYAVALNTAPAAGTSISATDLTNWVNALNTQLPNGTGSIAAAEAAPNASTFTITVQWDESKIGGSANQRFVFITQL